MVLLTRTVCFNTTLEVASTKPEVVSIVSDKVDVKRSGYYFYAYKFLPNLTTAVIKNNLL
jgi:hypothetical protein